jgi:hypothetical protein
LGTQITDLNPGINPYPDGLFWTLRLASDSVQVNPGAGRAIYSAENIQIADYGNFDNSFGGGAGIPATVSFEVRWSGVQQRVNIKDEAARFGGEFVRGNAQMSWKARIKDIEYVSDPIDTSFSDFAELGTERNGVFFPRA